MKIFITSKTAFDSNMRALKITNENVEERDTMFFISINGTEHITDDEPYFQDKENVKVLRFDDVEEDLEWEAGGEKKKAKAFTIEQARELYDFVVKHKDKKTCVVHCAAGISRSGAVGTFISDFVGDDYWEFRKHNPHIHPNGTVLRLLARVHRERNP